MQFRKRKLHDNNLPHREKSFPGTARHIAGQEHSRVRRLRQSVRDVGRRDQAHCGAASGGRLSNRKGFDVDISFCVKKLLAVFGIKF